MGCLNVFMKERLLGSPKNPYIMSLFRISLVGVLKGNLQKGVFIRTFSGGLEGDLQKEILEGNLHKEIFKKRSSKGDLRRKSS